MDDRRKHILAVFAERWIRTATHRVHLDSIERWLRYHGYPLIYILPFGSYNSARDVIKRQLDAKRELFENGTLAECFFKPE